jgi:hypothetical protein
MSLSRYPFLDQLTGFHPAVRNQGEPCAADANMSDIGGLLLIALCGHTSL